MMRERVSAASRFVVWLACALLVAAISGAAGMAWPVARVFTAAFVLDWIYVLWIRSCSPPVPWRMGLYSGGIALTSVIGIGGALAGHPVAYVLGYAAGSFAVGLWSHRVAC